MDEVFSNRSQDKNRQVINWRNNINPLRGFKPRSPLSVHIPMQTFVLEGEKDLPFGGRDGDEKPEGYPYAEAGRVDRGRRSRGSRVPPLTRHTRPSHPTFLIENTG